LIHRAILVESRAGFKAHHGGLPRTQNGAAVLRRRAVVVKETESPNSAPAG
jgi:hypothetical protein